MNKKTKNKKNKQNKKYNPIQDKWFGETVLKCIEIK